jgi:hypothetical protein
MTSSVEEEHLELFLQREPFMAFSLNGIEVRGKDFLTSYTHLIHRLFQIISRRKGYNSLENVYSRYFERYSTFHDEISLVKDESTGNYLFSCLWRRGNATCEEIFDALFSLLEKYPIAPETCANNPFYSQKGKVTRTWLYNFLMRWQGEGSLTAGAENDSKKDSFLFQNISFRQITKINQLVKDYASPIEFVAFVANWIHGRSFKASAKLYQRTREEKILKTNYLPLLDAKYYEKILLHLQSIGLNSFDFTCAYFCQMSTFYKYNLFGLQETDDISPEEWSKYVESLETVQNIRKMFSFFKEQQKSSISLKEKFDNLHKILKLCSSFFEEPMYEYLHSLRNNLEKEDIRISFDALFYQNENGTMVYQIVYFFNDFSHFEEPEEPFHNGNFGFTWSPEKKEVAKSSTSIPGSPEKKFTKRFEVTQQPQPPKSNVYKQIKILIMSFWRRIP